MVLDISPIINNEGKSLDVSCNISFDEFSFNGQDVRFVSPVSISGKLRNVSSKFFLELNVNAEYIGTCSRCLGESRQTINFDVKEFFAKAGLEDENDDVIILNSNEIDLKELIEQALCCALPITCLCSDECKGLCSVCGCNLNLESCSCEADNIDPRLAVLKDFLK